MATRDIVGLKEVLDLLSAYPNVHQAILHGDGGVELVFFEPKVKPEPFSPQSVKLSEDMPPDDVMLFAATEDIDELMKQRDASQT